eukprot:CAMPEP_0178956132 /NCGR_PEP_ID=MMETSP0789-20121207/10040_1 /TAXON_ID=3005 /ORGANISM="Rhizosolenia setigera, Strain CCMP 1694" /LENGTH=507 /DNA_ID=CAMNT_0020637939 /DNA_START=170 /DNA_END=1693 /DNA_ORIENTATION=+
MSYANNIRRGIVKGGKSWPRRTPSLSRPRVNNEPPAIDMAHYDPIGSWLPEKVESSRRENPFMLTWAQGQNRHKVPIMTHGEGVYLFDDQGNKYLDWTSQAVCANLGHSLPESIVQAAAGQMSALPFVYGGIGITEVRVRLNQLMAEILPGDLRAAVYPSSGAEANEAGIMMAKRFTGRSKVISWYRSYHGATANALGATGDYRRWYGGDQVPGMIKAFNPFPLFFEHAGATQEEKVQQALNMLEEQILNEGPDDIASIMMESIVGAGGVLVMPDGYMQGVRAICDEYGILMHCDEVMVGFGRTGKLFGFQNYEGVMPDIVSAAKGISSAAVPLSMTACSEEIMSFFEDKPLGYGSTYQAHPVAMACAYENIKHLFKENIVGRVQDMAPLFEAEMARLAAKHPSIKQYRSIGIFGCLDIQEVDGSNPKLQHVAPHEAFLKYKKAFNDNGLVGLHRYPHIHCAPPLNITEAELIDGFNRLDNALDVLDAALGYDTLNTDTVPAAAASS